MDSERPPGGADLEALPLSPSETDEPHGAELPEPDARTDRAADPLDDGSGATLESDSGARRLAPRGPGAVTRHPYKKGLEQTAEAKRALRRSRGLEFKARGWTFAAIGEELGVSEEQARQDYLRAVKACGAESAEELSAEADAILRAVIEGNTEMALAGSSENANVVIKAIAEHARIRGYRAPERLEHTGTLTVGPTIMIPPERPDVVEPPAEQPHGAPTGHSNGAGAAPPRLAS